MHRPITQRFIPTLVILLLSGAAVAEEDPNDLTDRLNTNYNNTTSECTENDSGTPRGYYYCSGVLIRGTAAGNFYPWDASPNSNIVGAVPYTWIRKDLSTDHLYNTSGYILRAPIDAVKLGLPPNDIGWRCMFPFDGWTGTGANGMTGCDSISQQKAADVGYPWQQIPPPGPVTRNTYAWGSCGKIGVVEVNGWWNYFKAHGYRLWDQCSWNVEDPEGWKALVEAHQQPVPEPYPAPFDSSWYATGWIEMLRVIGTSAGGTTAHIDAFFYDSRDAAAMSEAKKLQQKYRAYIARRQQAHPIPPIVKIDFSQAPENRFSYQPSDQSTGAYEICGAWGDYIKSAVWVNRFDPGTARNEDTLVVTPTDCGRQIAADQTEQMYAELVRKHANDPQWKSNDGGGMRRQVICHYVIARNKATYNLEPFRPNVSHAQSIEDGCNSTKVRDAVSQ